MQKATPITKSFEAALEQVDAVVQKAEGTDKKQEVSAYSFPNLYEGLGIDTSKLGCIMLDTEKIPVMQYADGTDDDLYYNPDQESYMQGAVAEHSSHITVLYGLMESGHTWMKQVNIVLKDWNVDSLTIDHVDYFDNPTKDNYCIIAHIKVTPELIEGNGRLRFLPHVDTFMGYKPHVTLAYVKKDPEVLKRWVGSLSAKLDGTALKTTGLNYGD